MCKTWGDVSVAPPGQDCCRQSCFTSAKNVSMSQLTGLIVSQIIATLCVHRGWVWFGLGRGIYELYYFKKMHRLHIGGSWNMFQHVISILKGAHLFNLVWLNVSWWPLQRFSHFTSHLLSEHFLLHAFLVCSIWLYGICMQRWKVNHAFLNGVMLFFERLSFNQ